MDDLDHTLRFDGTPMVSTDKTDVTANILVPADLPSVPFDLAIRAELLAADGKAVVASAVTPAYRLETIQPLRIDLAGTPQVEAKAGTGETGRLTGRITRLGEFPHPVTVTLTGLPGDFLAPAVEVGADATEFALPVSLPFKTPEGALAQRVDRGHGAARRRRRGAVECGAGRDPCRGRGSAAGAVPAVRR